MTSNFTLRIIPDHGALFTKSSNTVVYLLLTITVKFAYLVILCDQPSRDINKYIRVIRIRVQCTQTLKGLQRNARAALTLGGGVELDAAQKLEQLIAL